MLNSLGHPMLLICVSLQDAAAQADCVFSADKESLIQRQLKFAKAAPKKNEFKSCAITCLTQKQHWWLLIRGRKDEPTFTIQVWGTRHLGLAPACAAVQPQLAFRDAVLPHLKTGGPSSDTRSAWEAHIEL